MGSTPLADPAASARVPSNPCRLYVAWQDPVSREIVPVGCLSRDTSNGGLTYEYAYLRCAARLDGFRPFVGFPAMDRTYRSSDLFPFFENRLMPRGRDDYGEFLVSLGLPLEAEPFEVLARSEGRRQTDTIEVFPEPSVEDGIASCRFLVHGIRYVPGSQDAIESLVTGDSLRVVLDPQNRVDRCAVVLRDDAYHLLGWVPRYLTSLVRTPLAELGPDAVEVHVEHIGDREGPVHLRLLCALESRWPGGAVMPFSGPDFEPLPERG
ncbi:MAG TPA: HIRAN domain-containing protein [Acidimicrobiales bacterium]|nr:HIRAN domain-containing protein [Acidimicrobiales bacterium]